MSKASRKLNFNSDETKPVGANQPLIDYSQLAKFLIQSVPSRAEAIQVIKSYASESSPNDPISIIFKIDEVLRPFDEENLRVFSEIPEKSNVIAFQSSFDGKFCVVWKFDEIFTLNVLNDLTYEELLDLCKFVVKFLSKCLRENHPGLAKPKKHQTLILASLIDINGLDLLHTAAQNGSTKIVKILLQSGFSVDTLCNRRIPADRAYENQNFETLLELLKAKSQLPKGFNINACPREIQEFLNSQSDMKPSKKKKSFLCPLLIYTVVILALVIFISIMFLFNQKLLWRNLDEGQRAQVMNGTVKFAGIESKFSELYANDSSVFDWLSHEQLLTLMEERVLDLDKEENRFLETEIFLSYENMSEGLRNVFEASVVDFQGRKVPIIDLVGNETDIYDILSSSEVLDLLKNESMLEIGRQMLENDEKPLNLTIQSIASGKSFTSTTKSLLTSEKNIKVILFNSDNATTVKNLAMQLKRDTPQIWIEYFDLKSFNLAQNDIFNAQFSVEENLVKLLGTNSKFEEEVLRKFIDEEKLVIFWDSFDEISFNFIEILFDLMLKIRNDTGNVQFVVAHPQYEGYIAEKFDYKVHKLFLKRR